MIEELTKKLNYDINDLLSIMKILRSENGCNWDKVQTSYSIRQALLEESCEAIDAIENGDVDMLKEELGDILFQVVFHSQIYSEKNSFDFNDVVDNVSHKMIERHPHVFNNAKFDSMTEQLNAWENIKNKSHGDTDITAVLKVPKTLPALMRTEKIIKRAKKADIDLPEVSSEIKNVSVNNENIGQILFDICKICQENGIDAEEELRVYTNTFIDSIDENNN